MVRDTDADDLDDTATGEHNRLRSLGKYVISDRLGAGGMGTVFLAVDKQLNRTVALKVLPKDRARNPTLVRRFKAEGQAAAHLEHPGIVKVYEAGESEGFLYIALEYVDGIDCHDLVAKRGVLPLKRSIDIIRQVAEALAHAHSKGIVHRDIKPSNLMIKRDGTVKLADMGLARSIDDTLETNITRAGTTVGTVDYMSPEQARNSKATDTRSDIYSLGCTWYHLLTGRPPFPDGSMTNKLQAHATGARPDPRVYNDSISDEVVSVMHRMMERRPEDRYQTPEQLVADLELLRHTPRAVDAIVLEALSEEVGTSTARRRPAKRDAPAALPPIEVAAGPVDASTKPGIDLEVFKYLIPAVLVMAVLGVLVWAVRQGGDALTGGSRRDNPYASEPAEAEMPATVTTRPGGSGKSSPAGVEGLPSDTPPEEEPPQSVAVPFPGAEDAATTSSGVRLVPDWVQRFRTPRRQLLQTLKVNRRAAADDRFARLPDALKQLPRQGGIVELESEGPFTLEPIALADRGQLVIRGNPGVQPVVNLVPSAETPNHPLLSLRSMHLSLEDVHLVLVNPGPGLDALIQVEGGDVSLRNVSITVVDVAAAELTAVRILGRASHAGQPATGHCLLENVVIRGPQLTAVESNGSQAGLVVGNSLLSSGGRPTLVLRDEGPTNVRGSSPSPREIRLLASTLTASRTAIRFEHSGTGSSSAPCSVVARQSVIAHSPSGETVVAGVLAELLGWSEAAAGLGESRAAGVRWSTEDCSFAGWPVLLVMQDAAGVELARLADTADWRGFWNEPLRSDTVADAPLPPEPGEFWTPGTVRLALQELIAPSGQGRQPGSRTDELSFVPEPLIAHVLAVTRRPGDPAGLGEPLAVSGTPVEIDLDRRRNLSSFLNSEACQSGTHVIVRGTGIREIEPITLVDKAVRLEFRSSGETPLVLQAATQPGGGALITLRNSRLDLLGARFKIPASQSRPLPEWLIRMEDSDLSIRASVLEGPLPGGTSHAGLIEGLAGQRRGVLSVEDSFLVTSARIVSGPVPWEQCRFRNCVLASGSDILSLSLPATRPESPAVLIFDSCTLATDRSVLRLHGAATGDGTALTVYALGNVFAGPVQAPASSPPASVSSGAESGVLVYPLAVDPPRVIEWWGSTNGFAPSWSSFSMKTGAGSNLAGSATSTPDFTRQWTDLWGPGHEANALTGPTDVVFERRFPEWSRILPESFELTAASLATTWGPSRRPIGADVRRCGPAALTGDTMAADPESPSPRGPAGTAPQSPLKRRNPF